MSFVDATGLTQAVAEIKAFCQSAFATLTHYHTSLGDASNTALSVNASKTAVTEGVPYTDTGYEIGTYAHAEGYNTRASGACSHAEGQHGNASGSSSHVEGSGTKASAFCSHAEGQSTTASSAQAHAEGLYTEASGSNSHAEGSYTQALSANQHVCGKYNVADSNSTYAEIIGNGTANNARSDARTLDWDGNEALGTVNHATSSTAAATAAKVAATGDGFCLVAGARVSVAFTYANTYASGAVTLNVNSTGAKTVYAGGSATSSSNQCPWSAGAICEFVYDGTNWHYLGSNLDGAYGLASLRDSVSKIYSNINATDMVVQWQFDVDNWIRFGYNFNDARFFVVVRANGVTKPQKNLVTNW